MLSSELTGISRSNSLRQPSLVYQKHSHSSCCFIIVDAWQSSSYMDIQNAGALRQGTVLLMRRQITENSLKQLRAVVVWLHRDGVEDLLGW